VSGGHVAGGQPGAGPGAGRVVVVGSVNGDYVVRVSRLPQPGETVTGGHLATSPGGKGANQAHAAARLGAAVSFIGAVGEDQTGDEERAAMRADGIDISGLAGCDGPSGMAMILVDSAGENMIAVAPGANDLITAQTVTARLDGVLDRSSVVLASLEVPLAAVGAAAGAAAAAGATMILNPAPAQPLPGTLLPGLVLTPNEGEIRQLVPAAADEQAAAATLLRAGARAVVITRGSRGATLLRPGAEPVHRPAPRVDVVDTVGAGDAFNGALAAGVAAGLPLEDGLARAVAAGAAACTGAGARSALPTAAQVAALLGA
jgi:ribokinase